MNVFTFCTLVATLLWSLTHAPVLFIFYLLSLFIYYLANLKSRKHSLMSHKRRIQIAAWNDTGDPSCYGILPVDLTNADKFLQEHNAKNPDMKLTYTHLALKALGEAMQVSKKINGKISFGNFVYKPSCDISVLVDVEGKNLVTLVVKDIKESSLTELNKQMKGKVRRLKEKKDDDTNKQIKLFSNLPTFVIDVLFTIISFVSYNLGLGVEAFKVKPDNFGYALLTNISGFGIENVLAPHTNATRSIIVGVICQPVKKPIVIDGKIEIRKILNFNVTFDHRFGDGSDCMKMLKRVESVWYEPEKYV